jgi:hypothetical protein
MSKLVETAMAEAHKLLDGPEFRALGIGASNQWKGFVAFYRGAWRPTAGWALVATIIVNGVALPIARLMGFHGEALDWAGLATFVTAFVALVRYRTIEKQSGVA